MADTVFQRLIASAQSTWLAVFYGTQGGDGRSIAVHKLAHSPDVMVDDANPLQTTDAGAASLLAAVGQAIDQGAEDTIAAVALTTAKLDLINVASGSKGDVTANDTVSQWSVISLLRGLFAKFSALDLATAALTTWVDSVGNEMGKAANAVITGLQFNLTTPSPADGATLPVQGNWEGRMKVTATKGIPGTRWDYVGAAGGIINNAAVDLAAAPAAGLKNYISQLFFSNGHATVGTEIILTDGTTPIWRGRAPALMTSTTTIDFDPPKEVPAASALKLQCVTTGAAVVASATGWVGK